MRKLASFLLCITLALGGSPGVAWAMEDGEEEISFDEAPEYVPQGVATGWYLRGDLGQAFGAGSGGNSFTGGVGLGYRFNDWLRADATVEMQRPGAKSGFFSTESCDGGIGTHCAIVDEAHARIYSGLANVYVDLGTVAGFTPYVGAGAGIARVSWGNVERNHSCVEAGNACVGSGLAPRTLDGASSWRFTYALSAGLAYDLDDRLKLDFGYRFSRIDSGRMSHDTEDGFGNSEAGFSQHHFRVGLRYSLQ